MSSTLSAAFYERHAAEVARDLLGHILVRQSASQRISGIITETEAYQGEEDLACHARAGKTPRTAIMYGPPGRAYIYFTYGMHWLLNAVTGPQNTPAAVLIRAIQPIEGLETIERNRSGVRSSGWCNGPAKLCKALAIDGRLNAIDLCASGHELWIEEGAPIACPDVISTPRIGIDSAPEPWRSIPWRFVLHRD